LCTALGARSLNEHPDASSNWLSLDLGVSGGIEPRTGQVVKLEIDLDDAGSVSVSDTVTVYCQDNQGPVTYTGTGTVTAIVTDTVTVEFSESLPNKAYCVITLDCSAEVCLRMIEGDMNLSGTTNTTDGSQVKLRYGQAVTDANCEWDFNRSNAINTTDRSQVKLRYGYVAPECP